MMPLSFRKQSIRVQNRRRRSPLPRRQDIFFRICAVEINVEVHLEPGAVWKASSNIEDYYPLRNNGKITAHESGLPSFLNSEYAGRPFHAFIYALGQENVTISGQGTIDGNESVFTEMTRVIISRVPIIPEFRSCYWRM